MGVGEHTATMCMIMCIMAITSQKQYGSLWKFAYNQDTRYKIVLLPIHVYNYAHIRHYSHIDIHNS